MLRAWKAMLLPVFWYSISNSWTMYVYSEKKGDRKGNNYYIPLVFGENDGHIFLILSKRLELYIDRLTRY